MARWRQRDKPEPVIPDWIRHEGDGGFVLADWELPEDCALPSWFAEHQAKARWVAARFRWLQEHPDVSAVLLQQLRDQMWRKRMAGYAGW